MPDRSPSEDRRELELRHLRSCLAQLPMLLAVSDRAARYVWSFAPHLDVELDAMLGRTDVELGEHPGLRNLYELKLRTLASQETCVDEVELPHVNGSRTFEITAAPQFDLDQLVGVVTIGVDVTANESRTRMREEQLRLVAHDLRQPLNVIAIAAAQLTTTAALGTPVSALGQRIRASVGAMSRVLEDILESGEWETGGILLRRERTDVAAFLREAFAVGIAPDGLLRLRLMVAPGCVGEFDLAKLGRAVLNLVDNALKFSPSHSPVVIEAGHDAGLLRIAVIDRGPGLDRDTAAHAFDKYRASRGSRASGGKGLGLYCARLIVEAHGGTCRIESRPGQGATFVIEIPTIGT